MRETRALPGEIEVRSDDDGKRQVITGYAAVFGSYSQDLGGFVEIIKPGAFRQALAEDQDVRALIDHDSRLILGRTKSGTLRLTEDDRGLHYEIDVPDTQAGRDVVTSIRRGDISGSSFSFTVRGVDGDSWREEGDRVIRELRSVDLYDVSPVTYPAYKATDASATIRALRAARQSTTANSTASLRLRLIETCDDVR